MSQLQKLAKQYADTLRSYRLRLRRATQVSLLLLIVAVLEAIAWVLR